MRRCPPFSAAALAILLVAAPVAAGVPGAPAPAGAVTARSAQVPPAAPGAQAWVLVDADSGVVLDAKDASTPRLVASTTKLLTALVARRHLDPDALVPVSARAAAMPPRKLDVQAGQRWRVTDLLYGLLLSSANDVAAVLAEASAGSLEGFAGQLADAATELGLADHPVVRDPSGLDDGDSVGGGNLLSARDLAIVARAVLADPLLAEMVATPRYEFVDPAGKQRSLGNHNKMLASYPGTIGMKTGYTSRAGQCLVAAATRDGRTLVSVVLGAASLYGDSIALLERGFAMAPKAIGTGDQLPAVAHLQRVAPGAELAITAASSEAAAPGGLSMAGRLASSWLVQLLMAASGIVAGLRARVKVRRARRRRRRDLRRAWADHPATQPSVATRPRGDNPVENFRWSGDNRPKAGDLLGISRPAIDGRHARAHAAPSRSTTSRGDTSAASERRRGLG